MERSIPENDKGLRQRIEDLAEQVMMLKLRVEELTIRLGDLSGNPVTASASLPVDYLAAPAPGNPVRPKASTLLSTTASVSFLLVIALILRTASDSGLINLRLGAFIGLFYAFALFLFDYVRYAKTRRPIPIYSICGGLLIFAIDLENRVLFEALFAPLTYIILAAALLAMVMLGTRFSLPSLVCVGTIGASTTGIALGFPELNFPLAAGLLLLATVGSHVGARQRSCQWIPWSTLALTMFFWLVWSVKLCYALEQDSTLVENYALKWFLPTLACFTGWYLLLPIVRVLREDGSPVNGKPMLPVVTVAWVYPVSRYVFLASGGSAKVAGGVGIALGVVFFVLALWLIRQSALGKWTAISFVTASLMLWFAALPAIVERASLYIPVWSLLGLCTAVLSTKWQSRILRGVSYMTQVCVCAATILYGSLFTIQPFSVESVCLPVVISIATLSTYVWCRQRPIRSGDTQAVSMDPNDRAALVPLLIAVLSVFGALRIVWSAMTSMIEVDGSFQGGQSVMINMGAIAVAIIALSRKSGELLFVSVLIALVGGLKVFAYDLLHIQGLPLVLSVFSFGVTAGVGALIWKRWQLLDSGESRAFDCETSEFGN